MRTPAWRRLRLEWLACVVAALGFSWVLQYTGALERVDLGLYDAVLHLGSRPASTDVVVVAIDASSLAELGRWPWSRAIHAELLDRLADASPRAVALDLMFIEPEADSAADAQLAKALARLRERSEVWLPVTAVMPLVEGRPAEALRPLPLLEQAVSGLGHIHVELDADAVVRSLYLYEGTAAAMWPALSARLAGLPAASGKPGPGGSIGAWLRQSRRLIPFSGPAGHYRSVPYAALLRGEVSPHFLRGKLVLVGLTATGIGDHYSTPFSATQGLVPGVEINAAVLDGLLNGRMLAPLTQSAQWALGTAVLLGWMAMMWWLGPRAGLAALAAAMALALATSAILQLGLGLWWSSSAWLAAMLLGYLLWSWRRLAALFADLHRRAVLLGGSHAATKPGAAPDSWQRVTCALDVALEAKRQRDDTLQLLSHDLRAPQSAILALLQSHAFRHGGPSELHAAIELQVRTTLTLAEDFVMQLRAESDTYTWLEVELGQVLHEVRERALPLARARGVTLALALPAPSGGSGTVPTGEVAEDEGYWVRADPRLLDRALFNLLENAIKYSPSGTTTTFSLAWSGTQPNRTVVLSLRDQGRGIAAIDLPHLFERYSRFAPSIGETTPPGGHGLGLWLVKAVVERHAGKIVCNSRPGQGTTFVITLPEAISEERQP